VRNYLENDVRASGPESTEPALEFCEGQNVGPGAPDEHGSDGGSVDPGDAGDFANAALADGVPEVHDEQSGGFDDGIVGSDIGPADAEVGRNRARRSRAHSPSVAPTPPNADAGAGSVVSPVGVILDGRNYRQRSGEVIAALESYTPNVSAHNWEAVQDFARDAAALAAPTSAHSALRLLQVAGPFVVWCTAEQGLPLDAELLFAPTTIDAYCTGLTLKESTRGTYRSVLLIISKVLVPEAHQPSMVPMHRRPIQVPYTKDQVIQFRAWAKGQRTHLGRQKAMLLLAFVLGAGLTPGELGLVKREDITIDEAGVLIQVHGKLPRIVPMLRAWEKWVVAIAKRAVTDTLRSLAPVGLNEAHVRERERHDQDVEHLAETSDHGLGLTEIDLRSPGGPDQLREPLAGVPVAGVPFLDLALHRRVGARERMLGNEPVKDPLRGMALFPGAALVFAEPLLDDALEPRHHRCPGPGQPCRGSG
jgi:hypothetical protein